MTAPVPDVARRVEEVLAGMTLEEKLAQLVGVWVDAGSGAAVAPLQDAMLDEEPAFEEFARDGIGQITRFYGTAPVDPVSASRTLRERQRWLVEHTRTGIRAVVHEECLTGLAAWTATTFPAPLSWGASFDPELVQEMGRAIGTTMRSLGIHQGLAPVLDVVRDARWGRSRATVCAAEAFRCWRVSREQKRRREPLPQFWPRPAGYGAKAFPSTGRNSIAGKGCTACPCPPISLRDSGTGWNRSPSGRWRSRT